MTRKKKWATLTESFGERTRSVAYAEPRRRQEEIHVVSHMQRGDKEKRKIDICSREDKKEEDIDENTTT